MIIFAVILGLSTLALSTNTDNMIKPQPKTSKELYLERGGVSR